MSSVCINGEVYENAQKLNDFNLELNIIMILTFK